ncbi:beta-glucan synthesis-associated protein [Tilletia horrida]|uniref:Beta-glucan synthesis-associated protein n=1 Tax=Tilletia horrida TaxID=155126 RepID=A0AAN6JK24_9BASI|nr:beta-glucan synthesis-associated protein [Tilletia horrida]KAK0529483.1 beta-glucan synthesis-associated protein [Tilletia horrida]KAK0531672.1 beta-glucan synthesis-associated protein [Tilletia horrida]KAK0561912.1 beta-glucan synthesis-associated protein [Tilletia horrida]
MAYSKLPRGSRPYDISQQQSSSGHSSSNEHAGLLRADGASSVGSRHTPGATDTASDIGAGSEYGPYSYNSRLQKGVPASSNAIPQGKGGAGAWSSGISGKGAGVVGSTAAGAGGRYAVGPGVYGNPNLQPEPDDYLHSPEDADKSSGKIGCRGLLNIITLVGLALALITLFAGYPIIYHFENLSHSVNTGSYNIGGTNGSGQVPDLDIFQVVDPDTPKSAYTFISGSVDENLKKTNKKFNLVFSDEFNQEGRTFWKGDDPFWEAVDIWYGATLDYEWYSPEAINTTGGNLVIALEPMAIHDLNFRSGMLQSWNKFCYQGGYIEFSMLQPGTPETMGYWPALWMMGNLGRPGYLGSTEGLWPYSYDSCDTGILKNQMFNNGTVGPAATVNGIGTYSAPTPDDPNGPKRLSSLPGMRFPACTCPGYDHPGPNRNVGRSAAELDVIESQIQYRGGAFHSYASQSLQTAPFDAEYQWGNKLNTDYYIYDDTVTRENTYTGGPYQECASGLTQVPDDGFEESGQRFIKYGVEYGPDWKGDGTNAYVTWYVDGVPSWTVFGSALAPRPNQDIGQRLIPVEPMSIIMNLGMAPGFQPVRFNGANAMTLPTSMKVDYVRLYQLDGQKALIGCDPDDHPTLDYINSHPDLYLNHDYLRYNQSNYTWPLNKLTGNC